MNINTLQSKSSSSREIWKGVGSSSPMAKDGMAGWKMESLSCLCYLTTAPHPQQMTDLTGLSHEMDCSLGSEGAWPVILREGRKKEKKKSHGGGDLFGACRLKGKEDWRGRWLERDMIREENDWRGKWVWDNWYFKWSQKTQRRERGTSFPRVTWVLVLQLTKHKRCPLFTAFLPLSAHHGCNQKSWAADEFR